MTVKRADMHAAAPQKAAAELFDKVLYLKIKNGGVNFSDIFGFEAFSIISGNPGTTRDELSVFILRHCGKAVYDFALYNLDKGLERLERLGLVRQTDYGLQLTSKGAALHAFLTNDKNQLEIWMDCITYPTSAEPGQISHNKELIMGIINHMAEWSEGYSQRAVGMQGLKRQ